MSVLNRFQPYIPQETHDTIKNFKYQGGDLSYLYTYFYQPICDQLLKITPVWLA